MGFAGVLLTVAFKVHSTQCYFLYLLDKIDNHVKLSPTTLSFDTLLALQQEWGHPSSQYELAKHWGKS